MPVNLTLSVGTLFGFLLVLTRVAGAFVFVPLPGVGSAIAPARAAFALGFTLALASRWPVVEGGIPSPGTCQLFDLLKGTVRITCCSDVPLGAFLSGGVDSSTIVGLMREVITGELSPPPSVLKRKRTTNCRTRARWPSGFTPNTTSTSSTPTSSICFRLLYPRDEPFADSSAIPTYYVSKTARENVTVALSGEAEMNCLPGTRVFGWGNWSIDCGEHSGRCGFWARSPVCSPMTSDSKPGTRWKASRAV